MTRKITFQAGQYYHLYNRGVNRQAVFFNADNWAYFVKQQIGRAPGRERG